MAGKQKLGEYEAKLRIRKGDRVQVISGKDKGRIGTILRAFPKINKVLVQADNPADGHINQIVKHQKARQSGRAGRSAAASVQEGGRIEKPAPLYVPKVMLVCPSCHRPTRVGYIYSDGEGKASARKHRVCKHPDCAKRID